MKKTISIVLVLALGLATMSLAAEDTWTRKTNMPTPRALISTSVVDGVIYAIGGGTGPYSDFSTVEAYDPKTDTWTTKINMPTPRAGLSTCAVDGIIYAIGGHWSPGLATVEAYNPVTDNWTSKTPMPTSRGFLSVSVVDGIIYAIGGCKDVTGIGLSNVEAYDPKTNTWTEKAPMPTARLLLTTCEVDGIIYAIGGASTFTPGASTLKTVEAYDPAANTWTEKADMPTLRGGHSTSVVDRIIYTIGGVKYGGGPGLSTVEAYDPVTDIWTTKTDMPTARKFLSSSAVDGKIYAIGGVDGGQVLATVEEYDTRLGILSPDFNGNGIVDIKDLLKLIESWGLDNPLVDIAPLPFGDDVVDALDLEILMSFWEQPVDDPTLIAH
jgi:N-acetylneuraminic acid mutarotase